MGTLKQQLLLLEDVDGLGRQGDIVKAKRGYVRNFLVPLKKALIADKNTLKKQARLQAEREKRAAVDRKESEEIAAKLKDFILSTEVKVDPEGKMYGSVSSADIVHLLGNEGVTIERRQVLIPQALKALGSHKVPLRLKEGVEISFTLQINPEGGRSMTSSTKAEEEKSSVE